MKRFARILYVVDSRTDDTAAFEQAAAFATKAQARLVVVSVVDDIGKSTADLATNRLRDTMVELRREELQLLVNSVPTTGLTVEVKVLAGRMFIEVIREVLRYQHDLVIKRAEVIEGIEQLFGGTDMKLLRMCPCPLWVLKSTRQKRYRQVLAAVDYDLDNPGEDALNGQILRFATSVALTDVADLHVVHAWRLQHESFMRSPRTNFTGAEVDAMVLDEENRRRSWLQALVNEHCASQGDRTEDPFNAKIHLPKGDARRLIPQLADELGAELIVMGTVSRTGVPGFIIGNTAETILGRINCSVLTVKPGGFTSPVTLVE